MVASFDVERVVEALPGFLHLELVCGWCGWRERIGLDKVPIASFVHARDVMVLIVDDERLRIEAIREPVHDERYDRGFWVAARTPKAPFKLFEPQELKDMMARSFCTKRSSFKTGSTTGSRTAGTAEPFNKAGPHPAPVNLC